MKKLLPLLALFWSACAWGAVGPVQGHCYLGGTQATTSGANSSNYLNGIIPACTVKVYLHDTTTLATIYSNESSAPLANPFTANALPGVDPGGYIFWAAANQGYDIVTYGGLSNPNCAIAPLCYTRPVTRIDVFPAGGASGGTGITQITGSNSYNCTSSSCNISGASLLLEHEGTPLTDQSLLNFHDTPANLSGGSLDTNYQPVIPKFDTIGGMAWETLAALGTLQMALTPPASGQYAFVPASVCTIGTVDNLTGVGTCATDNSGARLFCGNSGPLNPCHLQIAFGFALPSYISQANITAVYGMSWTSQTGALSNPLTCGGTSIAPGGSTPFPLQSMTAILSPVPTISTLSCTSIYGETLFASPPGEIDYSLVGLFIYYTGTPPPVTNPIQVNPPLYYRTNNLGLSLPYDYGTDATSTNAYNVSIPAYIAPAPGETVKLFVSNSNTITTPSLAVNGWDAITIIGPKGSALSAGDLSTTLPNVLIYDGTYWVLQNPQVSGGGGSTTYALTMNNSGSGAASGATFTGSAAVTLSYNTLGAPGLTASNTFTGSLNDFSGVTQVKLPVAGGYASAAQGELGYDSTNLNWHAWDNGADNFVAVFPVSSPPTTGHCVEFLKTTNSWSLEDAGAACGSGSGGTNVEMNGGSALTTLNITGNTTQACSDTSGSGTAQSCSTATSFTPWTNSCIEYTTTTANSGTGLTINVNSLGAKSVAIASLTGWTTTLTAGAIPASTPMLACYTGTNWNMAATGFGAAQLPPDEWTINNGTAATPAVPYSNAFVTHNISACYFTTTTSDSSTNLVFNVEYGGSSIFSGGAQTITAGTSAGTISTLGSLTSTPLTITGGTTTSQQWEVLISTGASDWTGTIQCH